MQLSKRIWIAAACLIVLQFGVIWLKRGYVAEVQQPLTDIRQLPLRLGDEWIGEERDVPEEIRGKLETRGAHSPAAFTDRAYRNAKSDVILSHVAVWSDSDWVTSNSGTPHSPEFCYPGAGWKITDRKNTTLDLDDGRHPKVRIISVERDGMKVKVLFWYQMGEFTFATRNDWRTARRNFWGEPSWPSLIKVLLHTSADDPEQAELRLREIAELEFDRLQKLEYGPPPTDSEASR